MEVVRMSVLTLDLSQAQPDIHTPRHSYIGEKTDRGQGDRSAEQSLYLYLLMLLQ